MHPYLDHAGPIAFAHRGGAIDQPENTMPAFQNAVDLGYRYVETDVHVTSDGVLVAFHDPTLDRVTDRTGAINEMRWSDVAQARVTGLDGTVAPIPRLDELLAAFPTLRVNIDPKADTSVEPLIRALRAAECLDRVCVGSFSDQRLDRFRAAFGSDICLGLGTRAIVELRLSSWRVPMRRPTAQAAQVPTHSRGVRVVDPRFVETAHRHGLAVHVWTIDDADEMRRLLDLGVDGIMTDRPGILRDVFIERGLWDSPAAS